MGGGGGGVGGGGGGGGGYLVLSLYPLYKCLDVMGQQNQSIQLLCRKYFVIFFFFFFPIKNSIPHVIKYVCGAE